MKVPGFHAKGSTFEAPTPNLTPQQPQPQLSWARSLLGSERCAYAETTGGRLVELKSGLMQGAVGWGDEKGRSDLYLCKALWTGCRPEFFWQMSVVPRCGKERPALIVAENCVQD